MYLFKRSPYKYNKKYGIRHQNSNTIESILSSRLD